MIELVAAFMGVGILCYTLFAGADFGAGILELFPGKAKKSALRHLVTEALGPVWEVNHIWLILAVVVLFSAFPKAYSAISITFHIPITMILMGIIARGCAFTFRHHDVRMKRSETIYSVIFTLSSLLTPFALGLLLGGILAEKVDVAQVDFFAAYIRPWYGLFPLSVAIFVCCLFTYEAAILLYAEGKNSELFSDLLSRARITLVLVMLAGLAVFAAGVYEEVSFISRFLRSPGALACVGLASIFSVLIWGILKSPKRRFLRFCMVGQVLLIVGGLLWVQFPVLLDLGPSAPALDIYNTASPPATLKAMLWALCVGSSMIFPAIGYLLRIFKSA